MNAYNPLGKIYLRFCGLFPRRRRKTQGEGERGSFNKTPEPSLNHKEVPTSP
jgi:hypothetical protein